MFEFFHNFVYDMETFVFTMITVVGGTLAGYAFYKIDK